MNDKTPHITIEPDDLELVAYKDDPALLVTYLKTRRVWIPRRPSRFIDPVQIPHERLLEMIKKDAEELSGVPFEPWILEVDGMKRLPAFSTQKKMQKFASVISQKTNKVFSLAAAEVLLWNVTKKISVDFVDLNLFCERSWEIRVQHFAQ